MLHLSAQYSQVDLRVQGTLPEALGRLTNLRQFILSGNALVGSLPAYVGAYPGVGEAWLNRNKLSGQLNDGLCSNPAGRDSIHLQASHSEHTMFILACCNAGSPEGEFSGLHLDMKSIIHCDFADNLTGVTSSGMHW